jgi:hypothetical protein
MNADLLLQKLTRLDDIKNFISLLEIKFSSEEKNLSNLEIAKNSLDKALIGFAFEIEETLEKSTEIHDQKIEFSAEVFDKIYQEISQAFIHLKDFNDASLNLELLALVAFFENLENKILPIINSTDLQKLKAKILSIKAERIG